MTTLTPSGSPPTVLYMMSLSHRMGKKGRDGFTTALAIWILAFSAIIPSLDRELVGSGVWIESEHDEACAPHHDHTICIQFGKLGWSNAPAVPLRVSPLAVREPIALRHSVLVELARRSPTRARAPPRIT